MLRTPRRPSLPLLLVALVLGCGDAGNSGIVDALADADAAPDAPDTADTPDTEDPTDAQGADDTPDADAADVPLPAPPELLLTVNDLPAAMNGSVGYTTPAGVDETFTLRVNRAGFTVDVRATPTSGPIDWDTLVVACADGDRTLTIDGFVAQETARHRVRAYDADAPLVQGVWSCEASAGNAAGTATSALTFAATDLPPALDPFPEVDPWLVVLSRDIFRARLVVDASGAQTVVSDYLPAGDGVADFDEAFVLLGLFSATDATARDAVRAHVLARTRAQVNRIFELADDGSPTEGGVPIQIWFEGDPDAPDPADFDEGNFSMIALGGDGDPEDQARGTFGRALIDWNNQGREDDTVYGLGVFPTAIVRAALQQDLALTLLEDVIPSVGGTAFGDGPNDALFIGADVDGAELPDAATRQRNELYKLLVDYAGLGLASILTHEMGHSLGLVPPGKPPEGLFAGVSGPSFRETVAPDAHIDTPGLNVMQTGGSVDIGAVLGGEVPSFNPLNRAYLRRQLVVGAWPER